MLMSYRGLSPVSIVPRALFRLDLGVPDDALPLGELGLDEGCELGGGLLHDFGTLRREMLLRLRRGEDDADLLGELVDDRLRRAGRSEDAPPVRHLVAGHPGLGD